MIEVGFQREEKCVRVRVSTEKIVLVVGFQREENCVIVRVQKKNSFSGRVSTRGEL